MDYSLALCFAGFYSKGRKFQQEKREKEQYQQSLSRQSSMCHEKRPTKWVRKSVTKIFSMSQHKGMNIGEELCRDKRQRVATKHGKNVTSQLRQRKIMLRQGFSARCQHQEKPIAT